MGPGSTEATGAVRVRKPNLGAVNIHTCCYWAMVDSILDPRVASTESHRLHGEPQVTEIHKTFVAYVKGSCRECPC